ncbi:uncharacterized protein LOC134264572 [Saccostrea cucullata]|uniref:uncharacterized protein LOC134264572 n=1 Tax=Saccostrea cuccullata TaxID=36930 RepID=UPI002ED5C03D
MLFHADCQTFEETLLRCGEVKSKLQVAEGIEKVYIARLQAGTLVFAGNAKVMIEETSDPVAACENVKTAGIVIVKGRTCLNREATSTTYGFEDTTTDRSATTTLAPKVSTRDAVIGLIAGGITGLMALAIFIMVLILKHQRKRRNERIEMISLSSSSDIVFPEQHSKLA